MYNKQLVSIFLLALGAAVSASFKNKKVYERQKQSNLITNPCTVSRVHKWESWETFNPMKDVAENDRNVYKIARCTHGMSLSTLPGDIEVLYISGYDFSSTRESLAGVIGNLPNLIAVAIDLSDLTGQTTSALFRHNPNLRYVSITQCRTDPRFPAADLVKYNSELEVLILASDGIESLSPSFLSGNAKLDRVDFSQNKLRNISSNMFVLNTALRHLSLHGNNISSLPAKLLSGLRHLTEFAVAGNKLTSLPGHLLADNTALLKVEFQANSIGLSLSPDLFATTSELREANFNNNRIRRLPSGLFRNTPNLFVVKFAHNAIPTIGLPNDLFLYNPALFYVNLRGNAGMLPQLAVTHHSFREEAKNLIRKYGYRNAAGETA